MNNSTLPPTILLTALLSLAGAAVQAQEFTIDRTKLHVTDPAACQKLEDDGIDALFELGFAALSFTDGIQTIESSCHFFDVKAKEGNDFLFVSAVCENPGEIYPDTLAVTPFDADTVQVVSAHDAAMVAAGIYEPSSEGTSPGATLYHRCSNLNELPR